MARAGVCVCVQVVSTVYKHCFIAPCTTLFTSTVDKTLVSSTVDKTLFTKCAFTLGRCSVCVAAMGGLWVQGQPRVRRAKRHGRHRHVAARDPSHCSQLARGARVAVLSKIVAPLPLVQDPVNGYVGVFLPRNTNLSEVATLVPPTCVWSVVRYIMGRKFKGIMLLCCDRPVVESDLFY